MNGGTQTRSKNKGCSLDDEDEWHQFRTGKLPRQPFIVNFTLENFLMKLHHLLTDFH